PTAGQGLESGGGSWLDPRTVAEAAQLVEAARLALGPQYREDGPPLGFLFDAAPGSSSNVVKPEGEDTARLGIVNIRGPAVVPGPAVIGHLGGYGHHTLLVPQQCRVQGAGLDGRGAAACGRPCRAGAAP
ncbi:hypothetical protein HaLaN_06702, partial [Haematococcus lacustris]